MACKDKEARRRYKRKWEQAHKEARMVRNIETRYGLDIGGYNALFAEQGGRCAICQRHQSEFEKRLGVDHDHATGVVRGLLCVECNLLLGYAKDSPRRLEVAKRYLLDHSEGQRGAEVDEKEASVVPLTVLS